MRCSPLLIAVGATLVSAPAAAGDPGIIVLHACYGTPTSFVAGGRVLEDEGIRPPDEKRGRWGNFVDSVKSFETDEIVGVRVAVSVGGQRYVGITDDDGVWQVQGVMLAEPLPVGRVPLRAELLDQEDHPTEPVTGDLLILAHAPSIAVISDFDDTVANSQVTKKGKLLVKTLTRNAAQIEPVPGVSEAYNAALAAGAAGFFYVSGSPQNLHERIVAFMKLRNVPLGPVLLKNFGSDPVFEQQGYKLTRIERLLAAFPQTRFVLIGDSGEHDPEIYRQISTRHPGRIVAIVIRRVEGADNGEKRLDGMTVVDDYAADAELIARLVRGETP